jgi:metal-dependent amidase/aminoacylase/carboxypeptidase family protein
MPAAPELKARAAAAVEARRPEILELSARIHANPEPAFEEFQAAAWCAEAVAAAGYVVELPA